MTRPWLRLYREERGSFAQLSLVTRGIFNEILKLTDDDGVVQLGHRSPADAVAFALGADRGDRRALRRAIPELLADGCLVHRGNTLVAPGFGKHQRDQERPQTTRERTIPESRPNLDETTSEPRTNNDGATKVDLSTRNHVLAQNLLLSENKRVDTEREQSAGAREAPVLGEERVSFLEAQSAFSRLRQAHSGSPFRSSMRDHAKVTELADFATAQGATKRARVAVLEATIRGYLSRSDEWATGRGWPISGMTDLGVCYAAGRKLSPPEPEERGPETPRDKLRAELHDLIRLHATGRFVSRPLEDRIASIERREQVERELAAMERAS